MFLPLFLGLQLEKKTTFIILFVMWQETNANLRTIENSVKQIYKQKAFSFC